MTTSATRTGLQATTTTALNDLRLQYGCGPVQICGTADALYERHLFFDNVVDPESAGPRFRYETLAHSIRDIISERWVRTEQTYERERAKRIYYLSMEFLIGRSLTNNIANLLLNPYVKEATRLSLRDWASVLEEEPDAGLGNGGLGRLAACEGTAEALAGTAAGGPAREFEEQLHKVKTQPGFIAALDQSGGSTPHALIAYGIPEGAWSSDDEMFALVHQMRTRIITSPRFTGEMIFGAILFENTMDRTIEGRLSADYLWNVKRIVPFLKVDRGVTAEKDGVQLLKPIPDLVPLLARARTKGIFGTKTRSVIKHADKHGIAAIVRQQFDVARQVMTAGLVPIVEPEVDIHAPDQAGAEALLKAAILHALEALPAGQPVIIKLTLPAQDDFYADLVSHPKVARVVALSGGYSQKEGNDRLRRNHGVAASFSRALLEGLSATQSDEEFHAVLGVSIHEIFEASIR